MSAVIPVTLALFVILLVWKGKRTLHERIYPFLYNSEEFPEEHFPAQERQRFLNSVAIGYEKMKNSTIVICGITRDDAETLPLTIRRIEKSGGLFADYRVIVFENDSADRTPIILKEWANNNPNVVVLSDTFGGIPSYPSNRFERLACCRNRYLDQIELSPELDAFEFMMVVDMDLWGGWSYDGIASSFAENGWDAVASNSIGYHNLRRTYYDTLALKPPSVLKRTWLYRLIGEGWQFRRGAPLLPVESAFGGLCLYRREALRGRRYCGVSDHGPVCEHHALNADRRLAFFLNPSQITVTGTQESRSNDTVPAWRQNFSRFLLNW